MRVGWNIKGFGIKCRESGQFKVASKTFENSQVKIWSLTSILHVDKTYIKFLACSATASLFGLSVTEHLWCKFA